MKKYLVSIPNLVWLICMLTFVWSCEQASEPPPKPKVVRKKIIAQKDKAPTTQKVKSTRPTKSEPGLKQTPLPAAPKDQQPEQPSKAPKEKSPTLIAKKDKSVSVRKPKAKPAISPKSDISTPTQPVEDQQPEASVKTKQTAKKTKTKEKKETKPETVKTEDLKTAFKMPSDKAPAKMKAPPVYSGKGKIDPFEPLFRETKVASTKVKKPKRIKRVARTPLEKIALHQLKLVAIVLAKSGNRAMVEEDSGKGYVIKKGTYIGTNEGEVIQIDKDKVVVAEKIEDVMGNLEIRNTELKLPKPPGDL